MHFSCLHVALGTESFRFKILGSQVRFGRVPRGSGNDGTEDPDDATDYDSEEQNISTVEQTIISHTRILALQLMEVSKYVSYGGK